MQPTIVNYFFKDQFNWGAGEASGKLIQNQLKQAIDPLSALEPEENKKSYKIVVHSKLN